jgi:glycosyltransferase involved in cell wall biosynthesis
MKIDWVLSGTASNWSEEDYRDGGAVYETYVRKVLGRKHKISVIYLSRGNHPSKIVRIYQFGRYILKSRRIHYRGDVVMRDLFSAVFAPFDRRRVNVVILHHLDLSSVGYRILYSWIHRRFFKMVRRADTVVVVSRYWKNVLERAGCSDVRVIYNSFKIENFDFTPEELAAFEENFGIPRGKRLVYLGNARPEKGFRETFEALKGIDAAFVATGRKETELPIFQLYLSYLDYLKLLRLCSLVVTMSKFNEGWCRTAHEAMLCGTPVVGSGRGGMRELLERGGQVICAEFSQLGPTVRGLLQNPEKLVRISAAGREFAQKFSMDYFRENWSKLVDSVTLARNRIKVIHYTHNLDYYGIGSFLLNLLKAQNSCADTQLLVVYSKSYGDMQRFRDAGIVLHELPQTSARNVRLLRSFIRLFKDSDILVLHTYSPWAFLAGFLLGKKTIYTFHGAFGLKGRWTDAIKLGFYRHFVNRASDKMVFASATSLALYQNRVRCRLPQAKVAYFPFGLIIDDIKANRPRDETRSQLGVSDKFVIGTVLRFDPVKRIERLVETLSYLPDRRGFHLLIVGDGDGEYQEKILNQVRDRNLKESVDFLGYREDVFDIVNSLDLFVLPSFRETFGLALLEAMALGIPAAVFSDSGGCLDILGDTGFVVNSPRELSAAILRLKNDPGLKEDFSVRSRLRARQFDILPAADNYRSLYRELVKDKG